MKGLPDKLLQQEDESNDTIVDILIRCHFPDYLY